MGLYTMSVSRKYVFANLQMHRCIAPTIQKVDTQLWTMTVHLSLMKVHLSAMKVHLSLKKVHLRSRD